MEEKTVQKSDMRKIILMLHRGGRRAPARVFDGVFTGAAAFFAVYLTVRQRLRVRVFSQLLALAIFVMLFSLWKLVDRELLLRRTRRIRREARAELVKRKLRLMSGELIARIPRSASVLGFPGIESLTADDAALALKVLTPPARIVTYADPTPAAEELLAGSGIDLVPPHGFLGKDPDELVSVTEDEIDSFIIEKHKGLLKKPKPLRSLLAISRERSVRYAALGAVLILLSFLMRFAIYYRLLGTLTLTVGGLVFASDEAKSRVKKSPES